VDKIFQRWTDPDLPALSGLTIDAVVSVTESLAAELIALAVQENPQIDYCRVHIFGENRVTLDVKSPLWPWPFHLKLKLFSSVDLTHSPTVRAFLENHVLLGKLSSLFNALPDGINMYEDQIAIDIGAFVDLRERRVFLDAIGSIEIKTDEGRIVLDIAIKK
jgi:hypothetical protein